RSEETANTPQVIDTDALKQEFEKIAKDVVEEQNREVKEQYEELLKRLPEPRSPQEERRERIEEMITRSRIETLLREEARKLWAEKPEEERMKRAGFFRREEDRDKRDQFIREYIDEHLEERLKEEFNLI